MNFLRYGSFDIFAFVFFDTITACNRKCYYCPNSRFDRGLMKNMKKMDIGLFHKVIDELAALRWEGEITHNFYGEPLLDDRIAYLVKYTRDKLPDSTISLYTNGDFLTVDMYKELVRQGINKIVVTRHPGGDPPFIKDVFAYRQEHGDGNVEMSFQELKTIYNRGGVELREGAFNKSCQVSWQRHIGVHWDGNVIFCCNDYFVDVKLGNLRNERLIDIWRKPYYRQIRRELKKGIYKLEICRKCNVGSVSPLESG